VIRIKNLLKNSMVTVEIPVAVDGGNPVKRGVIDRAKLMGDQKDAGGSTMSLLVTKLVVPNTLTLLPRGKRGDTSDQYPDSVKNAPDIQRKCANKSIEIIQER
jgi:hypothetical protein